MPERVGENVDGNSAAAQDANGNDGGFVCDSVHVCSGGGAVSCGGEDSGDGGSVSGVVFGCGRVFAGDGVASEGDASGEFGVVHVYAVVGDGDGDSASGESAGVCVLGVDAVQRAVLEAGVLEFGVVAEVVGAGFALASAVAVGVLGDDAHAQIGVDGGANIWRASAASPSSSSAASGKRRGGNGASKKDKRAQGPREKAEGGHRDAFGKSEMGKGVYHISPVVPKRRLGMRLEPVGG